ncbi:MAG: ABC transporter permease subunit [Actinobacteria bacterium]|nr:ABC transporter permease subunit [Actinomycetota bacterium]
MTVTADLRTAEPELLAHEGLQPAGGSPGTRRRGWSRRRWVALSLVVVGWSLARAGVGREELVNPGGWELLGRFVAAAVRPEVSPGFLRLTLDAALTTLSYAVLGTVLSVVLGLVFGVLASETWWGRGRSGRRGWVVVRALLSLPRGVHEVVWGLFLVIVLGLDPLVGILAIGIPYGMVTAKVFSELLDETPRRPFDALRRSGAGRLQAILYSLAPQARGDMVSYAFYRFECSIRAAAILGIIGAGGLGFQLALSFQSLRYREMWTLIYALVLLCGAADLWSSRLRRRGRTGAAPRPPAAGVSRFRPADRLLTGSLVATGLLVVVAVVHLAPDVTTLWSVRSRRLLAGLGASAWPPDLGLAQVGTLLRLSVETIEMAVVAIAVASSSGLAVALVAANRTGRWPGRAAGAGARSLLLLCRAIPPPVGALLFLFVLFPGPLPGALALGLYNFGILGRLMAEVIENLDSRPARGLRLQGASTGQALLYGVLPAALPRFVAYSLYRWEVTVRETVVVGLVGGGGLGRLLSAQLSAFDYPGVLSTLLALVLLTFAGDLVGRAVRRSVR